MALPDSGEEKTGYKPIKIKNYDLPQKLLATYIHSEGTRGDYYYVISWVNSSDGNPGEYDADSENDSRQIILREFRTCTLPFFRSHRRNKYSRLFGGKKDRLESIEKQSAATLQNQLLNTSSVVMQQYYNVVRQEAYLKTIQKSIDASEQRVAIVKTRQQVGVANQADVLQSNIDLNALLQAKQNQLLVIDQAKADLYNTMVQLS